MHFCRTNATGNMPDLTLKEAVEFLSHSDENYQQWGATFIQHTCYSDETAKSEVRAENGRACFLLKCTHLPAKNTCGGTLRKPPL